MNNEFKAQKSKLKTILQLLVWLTIGTSLRLTQLAVKPPWTDEFSTLVFSLGNSFLGIPLDLPISQDILLQPLQPNPTASTTEVVQHLLTESNHPPLYFVLAHWWMQLWAPDSLGLASVWAARSLSAILGAASIPAIYGLGWLAFRSRLVSQLAAAMMAVSPYSIFLAQEARHYTLAILWVIASLGCLVIATQYMQRRTPLPVWVGASWVTINVLGVSTHYFFILALGAEALVLIRFWTLDFGWIDRKSKQHKLFHHSITASKYWWRIYAVAVEASALPVVIASGSVMIIFFVWALPILIYGFKTQLKQQTTRVMTQVFAGVVCSAIAIFFIFTCIGIDITRGARYNFVYFPGVIILLGASLATCWNTSKIIWMGRWAANGRTAVIIIWLMGLISAITVVSNLGYQKYYRPDLLVQLIQKVSQSPVLIATTHKTHVQIGEMMGIAREFKLTSSAPTPQFLLAHQNQNPQTATATLQKTLKALPRPLDLWLVNFYAPVEITNCITKPQQSQPIDGYNYQSYHCKK